MPQNNKKPYDPPRIIHTETLQGRATACVKSDSGSCAAGPLLT